MQALVDLALRVADSRAPVLITGPNGSGKEKTAEILHQNGGRRDRPYITVDVGALPPTLIEAELFGAEPGAFTGAARARAGRFEAAEGGTLFLDEIGNLATGAQAALLRALSTGEITRLGSDRARVVDVRVISATNADLDGALVRGELRVDLYHRLAVVHLRVPPLRERPKDVLPLADHFLASYRGKRALRLGPRAEAALLTHTWPGNVRELENRIHRAALVARDDVIGVGDLDFGQEPITPPPSERTLAPAELEERVRIERVLREFEGSITRAAEELGLSRQALYRRLRRVGLVLERRPKEPG
jgi:DNA-binding NtrC family response regulator